MGTASTVSEFESSVSLCDRQTDRHTAWCTIGTAYTVNSWVNQPLTVCLFVSLCAAVYTWLSQRQNYYKSLNEQSHHSSHLIWAWHSRFSSVHMWCEHAFIYEVICWCLLMWEIGRRLGHYGDHPHPQVADRGTPSRVDKRVAPDREDAADKQCQGEGKLWSQYVITNREEGKGKPHRLFPKTVYPLGYPEPALQQKTEERERCW